MKKRTRQTGSVPVTLALLAVIAVLFTAAFVRISASVKERALNRMEEGVHTVINDVTAKLERDSAILNATADILSSADNFDVDAMRSMMSSVTPLLETMRVRILMADDRIITPDGSLTDASEDSTLSFAAEAPLGEHVSNRVYSTSGTPVLRHFVPIMQNGEVAALLYGVTPLSELGNVLNVDNIYNASASVFIIDTRNGDFLLDTYHENLGNIHDYDDTSIGNRKTKDGKSWAEYTADILALNSGYVVFRTDSTDGWDYLYYAPAGINQWAIGVEVPEREAFASVFAVRRICWTSGLLMALAVVVYYIIIRRENRRETEEAVSRAVLEEKLHKAEAAERAKTTFLSNMSHDIRTPMNAIIGFTTLAQTNLHDPDRVQDYLKKIMSSSAHLLSLINDILDMSRIESGKLNIEEKPCAISDIFHDMRNIIQTQMTDKQLNFFMDTVDVIDEDICCDKLHVNQILLNLLSNAIKFTPAGGSVSLTIRQKPGAPTGYGAYEIRVKDTGIGMSEEFAQHIFEPFERERNSTVSGIQGTGLGMAITKSIVDTMGGTIEVKTEQGKGTEFILNFDFRLQNEHKQVETLRELEGLRALVVDDSFETCDSVTKMLTKIGMRAEWSMHGREAVLRVRQAMEMGDDFYACIIDWALPDLGGIEVARQIRAIVGERTPIIILTAYDWSAFEAEARAAGVTAFCNKPLFLSELRGTLAAALHDAPLPDNTGAPVPTPAPTAEFKGLRLLLVEDNELNREIAVEVLSDAGFTVDTACDGTEAVDTMAHTEPGHYSLILMDIQMPRMDGYAATRAIRALPDPAIASVPIVAMTANAFDEDRQRALDSGMDDHVAKPIDIEKLMKTLRTLLGQPQPQA